MIIAGAHLRGKASEETLRALARPLIPDEWKSRVAVRTRIPTDVMSPAARPARTSLAVTVSPSEVFNQLFGKDLAANETRGSSSRKRTRSAVATPVITLPPDSEDEEMPDAFNAGGGPRKKILRAIADAPHVDVEVVAMLDIILGPYKVVRPVDGLPVKTKHGNKLVFCDFVHRSAFLFDAADAKSYSNQNAWQELKMNEKLAKPSSVALAEDGKILGLKDEMGVHFFDAESQTYLSTKVYKSSDLYGLELVEKTKFVTVDDKKSALVFIDAGVESPEIEVVKLDEKICRMRAQKMAAGMSTATFSQLRFLGVERGVEKPRIAISDCGHDCVYIVGLKDGTFIRKIGGHGKGPGQLRKPAGVVFLPGGKFLVADYMNDRIEIFGREGNYEGTLSVPSKIGFPAGLYLDRGPNDRLDLYVFHFTPKAGIAKIELKLA